MTQVIVGKDRSLRLRQIMFGSQVWNGDLQAPSAYIPAYYPSIPQGESTIQFIFHQTYDLTGWHRADHRQYSQSWLYKLSS